MLDAVGLDSSLYDMHSWRAGCSVDMQHFGYSLDFIHVQDDGAPMPYSGT